MKLADALFNWLQIHVVAQARPDDQSAQETASFFRTILQEDHQVSELQVSKDLTMYTLRYTIADKTKTEMYPIERVDELLEAIQSEPKYNT